MTQNQPTRGLAFAVCLSLFVVSGCTCNNLPTRAFACKSDQDCKSGSVCVNDPSTGERICMQPCKGGARDITSDVNNCGACGHVCQTPLHAAAACVDGGCTRGPCETGHYALDPRVFGCDATCANRVCTYSDGRTVTVTSDPVPETGLVQSALASSTWAGGSRGSMTVQTSVTNTNFGVLGQSTPPAMDGGVFQKSPTNINVGGFFVRPN